MTKRRENQHDGLFAELFELVDPAGPKRVEDRGPGGIEAAPLHAMLCVLATQGDLPRAPGANGHQPSRSRAGGRS